MAQNPIVTIEMEDGGKIVAELYPDLAPISVNNFISLAKKGFYDGLIFHRVISGFMIQGGDPQGIGIGGPVYCIKGEFSANGVKNPISHKRGVLSMARAQAMDSAGSQFFIMHADAPHLGVPGRPVCRLRYGHRGHGRGRPHRRHQDRHERQAQGRPAHEEGHRGDLRRGLPRTRKAVIERSVSGFLQNCIQPSHRSGLT